MASMEIRQHDLAECELLYPGSDPQKLLEFSLEHSIETFRIHRDDVLLGVGGVAEATDRPGYTVWLVGTPAMDRLSNQIFLLRKGKKILKQLLTKYHRLSNYCSSDEGQLWAMEKLGFTIYETTNPKVRFIQCV